MALAEESARQESGAGYRSQSFRLLWVPILSKIEKGERVPSLETIGRLADEMEMPMGAWFQELPSSNTETMKQFLDSQQSRLDKLSEDQLTNLQMLINQALNMAGA